MVYDNQWVTTDIQGKIQAETMQVAVEVNRIDMNVMNQHGDLIAVAAIALGIGEKDIHRFSYLATAAMRKYPNMSIPDRYRALIELAFEIKTNGN